MSAMNPNERDSEILELRKQLKNGPYGKGAMMAFNEEHKKKSPIREHELPYWDKK